MTAGTESTELYDQTSLFARLREHCDAEWRAYVDHPFVRGLGDGTLPEACFRHYLGQDYLFLIHLARAYALAAYKSDDLADMRHASEAMAAIVDMEMGLHVEFCAGWGLGEADLAALPEAPETLAYTRYVLERGLGGDILDLHVALAPCVVGYAEIGAALAGQPAEKLGGNPYRAWIEMYGGADYQAVARTQVAHIDDLAWRRAGLDGDAAKAGDQGRMPGLITTFRQATVLEAAFWDMGLAGDKGAPAHGPGEPRLSPDKPPGRARSLSP